MIVLSVLGRLSHRNGVVHRARIQIFERLRNLEEIVRHDIGVKDAFVSLKTNSKGECFLQIYVSPSSQYKRNLHFQKLQRRIIAVVGPRIGGSPVQIQVMRMKNPPHTPSPGPPLP